jgi:exonuclease SbcC
MILNKLSVRNFRKFAELEIGFPPGIIGVVGRNGVGKSTLLEIIAWLFYGSTALKTKNEEIYPDFLESGLETRARLDFCLNSGEFRVERGFKPPKKSEARLYLGDKLLSDGPREVSEQIQKLTGLDFKAFQTSFYTRQSELNLLTELRPAERGQRLEEMLRLDKINYIINNNIKGDLRQLTGEKEALDRFLEGHENIRQKLVECSQERESLYLQVNGLQEKSTSGEKRLKELQADFSELDKKRDEFRNLKTKLEISTRQVESDKKRLAEIKEEIEQIEKSRKRYELLRSQTESLEILSQKLENLEEQRVAFQKLSSQKERQKALEGRLEQIEADGKILGAKIERLEQQTSDYDTIINNIKSLSGQRDELADLITERKVAYSRTETELKRLRRQLSEIERLGPEAVCSFCLRPFAGEKDEIEAHFEREMKILQKNEQSGRTELQKRQKEYRKFTEELKSSEEKRHRLEPLRRELSARQGEINQMRQEFLRLKAEKAELDSKLAEASAVDYDPEKHKNIKQTVKSMVEKRQEADRLAGRIEKLEPTKKTAKYLSSEIDTINNNIEDISQAIDLTGFSEKAYLELKSSLEKQSDRLRACDRELADALGNLRASESRLEQLNIKLEEIEQARVRSKQIITDKIYLDTLKQLLGELKVELAKRIRPTLRNIASDLLEVMSDGKFTDLELDENYDIQIRDFGEMRELKRFSGGEQDLGNLSLRMAISRMLAESSRLESGFLILDEVFGSQDVFRQENILNAIAGLQDFFQQILIVTHVEDIKQSVSTLITIDENPDGSSSGRIE